MPEINTISRLRVSSNLEFVDLYLPVEVWEKLTKRINGNKLTVALRIDGEDGITIWEA